MKKNQNQKQVNAELRRTNLLLHKATGVAGTGLDRIARLEHQLKKKEKPGKKARRAGPPKGKVSKGRVSLAQNLNMRDNFQNVSINGSPFADYLRTLARPFENSNIFCPISYNPAPSFIQTRARTTSTNLNLIVAQATTTQLALFPGHVSSINANNAPQLNARGEFSGMDAVSYHHPPMAVAGISYSVGPIDTNVLPIGALNCTNMVVSSSILPNLTRFSTTALSNTAMGYDEDLPYTGSELHGHSRWQLVSMGIRVRNITNDLYRGGTIVSVQPNTQASWADGDSQSTFERYPTFHDWGNGGTELSWIPRTQDMAFWHTLDSPTATSSVAWMTGVGMLVWLNAPADHAQTYSFEVVYNWQLSGTYFNTVGGPAPHHPALKAPVEQLTSALLNSAPSANQAIELGKEALKATGLTPSTFVQTAMSLGKKAAGVAAAGFASMG